MWREKGLEAEFPLASHTQRERERGMREEEGLGQWAQRHTQKGRTALVLPYCGLIVVNYVMHSKISAGRGL